MKNNTIGIFGIGAIGSVIALKLNNRDNQIFYFNRTNKSKIELKYGNQILSRKIELSDIKNQFDLDWLIICLKEYHYHTATQDLEKLIGGYTKIAIIRNGINLYESISKIASPNQIVECIIDSPTQIDNDRIYIQLKQPIITIEKSSLSDEFCELFLQEIIDIIQIDNFKARTWEKLIESSALGGVLALSGETCWIFKDEKFRDLYEKIVDEGIAVAIAEGARIDKNFKKNLVAKLLEYPENKTSSMLIDRQSGNPIELNAKNGMISNLAKKHGIKSDLNDMISLLLKYTNSRRNKQ